MCAVRKLSVIWRAVKATEVTTAHRVWKFTQAVHNNLIIPRSVF